MKVFISGGCKNGKSTYAERIAVTLSKNVKPLYYIATMLPVDDEDRERIQRHRLSRKGLGFETVELGLDLASITGLCNMEGTFLLDSVTALLANEMFTADGAIHTDAHLKVSQDIQEVLKVAGNMVLVSDYIFSDAELFDEFTEAYRKGLAYVDRQCAKACDVVIDVSYGGLIVHKGKELLNEIKEAITI